MKLRIEFSPEEAEWIPLKWFIRLADRLGLREPAQRDRALGPANRAGLFVDSPTEEQARGEPVADAALNSATANAAHRFSVRPPRHSVDFSCDALQAESVCLVGDFNDWQADANPMQRTVEGRWTAHVGLLHGHHQYLFLVDGRPMLDPRATGQVHEANPWHDAASLVAVS